MKERKAVEKEIELTNVMNLQQDVIVIVRNEDEQRIEDDSVQPFSQNPKIEFSNLQSIDLFGIELNQMSDRQLLLPQFIPSK